MTFNNKWLHKKEMFKEILMCCSKQDYKAIKFQGAF